MKFIIESPSNCMFLPLKYAPCTKKFTSYQNSLINFLNPQIKIFCDQCQSVITLEDPSVWVQQYEQQKDKKSQKDYCLRCFVSFLRNNSRLNDQKTIKGQYYVRNPGVNCLSSAKWRVMDDLLLLHSISKFGYGNWNKMHYYMRLHGCYIDFNEYQKHFLTYFYQSSNKSNYPLLIENQQKYLTESSDQNCQKQNIQPKKKKQIRKKPLSDHFLQWKGVNSSKKQTSYENISNTMNQLMSSFQNSEQPLETNDQENPLMYVPQRDEYLIDHDPFAESLISNLQFNEEDTQEQIQMKEKLLLSYNQKLRERKKRKLLAINHSLVKTIAESHKKKNSHQQFFLNEEPEQGITGFLDPFYRLFRDEQEIRTTKGLILNHYNVKQIIGTLSWVKKQAKVKLPNLKSLESILRNAIQNDPDNYNQRPQLSKKKLIYQNQKFIQPSYEQKLSFIQSQLNKTSRNLTVPTIYQMNFKSHQKKTVKLKSNIKLQNIAKS